VALAEPLRDADDRHARLRQALSDMYLRRVRAHGSRLSDSETLTLLAMDIELNAQGLAVWLDESKAA
jgi:hypothetical protein